MLVLMMTPARISAARAVAAVAVGISAVVGLAACAGHAGTAEPTATSAAPSSSADSPRAQARRAALRAYNRYRKAYVAASAKHDYRSKDLAKYAGTPLLTQAQLALQNQADQGVVTTGRPSWSPTVTDVNVSKRPYSVSIRDCFDQSSWKSVDEKTGKSVAAAGQAKRYIIVSKAERYDDGRWLISTSTADRNRTC